MQINIVGNMVDNGMFYPGYILYIPRVKHPVLHHVKNNI